MEQNQPNFGGYGGSGQMNPNGVGFGAASGGQFGVSGDVVFSSGESGSTGGKKKFVIIGVVLGVLVVVAVVLGILASGGGGGLFGGGELAGFSELKEFIEKGDEETRKLFEDADSDEESESGESGEEYIMAIRISEKGETEVRKYYEKLEKLEQNFYNKSVTKVDSEKLSEYSNALKVLKNAINYYETKDGLILAYEDGGDGGAEAYFSENISCSKDSGDLKGVCSLEEKYYRKLLNEHRIFSEAGCFEGGVYDEACATDYYGYIEYQAKIWEGEYADRWLARIMTDKNRGIIDSSMRVLKEKMIGNNKG